MSDDDVILETPEKPMRKIRRRNDTNMATTSNVNTTKTTPNENISCTNTATAPMVFYNINTIHNCENMISFHRRTRFEDYLRRYLSRTKPLEFKCRCKNCAQHTYRHYTVEELVNEDVSKIYNIKVMGLYRFDKFNGDDNSLSPYIKDIWSPMRIKLEFMKALPTYNTKIQVFGVLREALGEPYVLVKYWRLIQPTEKLRDALRLQRLFVPEVPDEDLCQETLDEFADTFYMNDTLLVNEVERGEQMNEHIEKLMDVDVDLFTQK